MAAPVGKFRKSVSARGQSAARGATFTTKRPGRPATRRVDCGVNFFDTADVYGNGRSERLIADLKKNCKEGHHRRHQSRTPTCRRQTVAGYSAANLTAWVEDSLRNLATDSLDLLQLHCPPTELYYQPETFDILDRMVKAGKVRYYGVSVEKVEEALKAIEFPERPKRANYLQLFPPTARRRYFSCKQSEARWESSRASRSPAAC